MSFTIFYGSLYALKLAIFLRWGDYECVCTLCNVWWIRFWIISKTQTKYVLFVLWIFLKSQLTKDDKISKPRKITSVLNLLPSSFISWREKAHIQLLRSCSFVVESMLFQPLEAKKASRNKWKHGSEMMFLREEMEMSSLQITWLLLIIPAYCSSFRKNVLTNLIK